MNLSTGLTARTTWDIKNDDGIVLFITWPGRKDIL